MFEMGSPLQYLIYGYFALVLVAATTVINAELGRRRKSKVKYDLLDRLVFNRKTATRLTDLS